MKFAVLADEKAAGPDGWPDERARRTLTPVRSVDRHWTLAGIPFGPGAAGGYLVSPDA